MAGPHFGARVSGRAAFDKAVRDNKGGAAVFGVRVRGSIPADNARNIAARNTEHGVRVVSNAQQSNTKGEPADAVSIEELRNVLAENPTFFDSLYEAELARDGGARPDALQIFYEVERGIKGQGRQDVMEEIKTLLGQKRREAGLVADRAQVQRAVVDKQLARQEANAHTTSEAITTEAQMREEADRQGVDLSETGSGSPNPDAPSAKPDGDINPESSQPGKRQGVPAETGEPDSGSSGGPSGGQEPDKTDEQQKAEARAARETELSKLTVKDLTKQAKKAGIDTDAIEGTGADGAVLKGDLVKAILDQPAGES